MEREQVILQGFAQTGVTSALEQQIITQGYEAPAPLPGGQLPFPRALRRRERPFTVRRGLERGERVA